MSGTTGDGGVRRCAVKLGWFVVLWLGGVLAVGAVALLFKAAL